MECLRRLHGNVHSAIFRPRRGARCKRITRLPSLAVCQMAALCARTLPDRSVQSIFFLTAVFLLSSPFPSKLSAPCCSLACMRAEQCEGWGFATWTILCWWESELNRALPRRPAGCVLTDCVGRNTGGRLKSVMCCKKPFELVYSTRVCVRVLSFYFFLRVCVCACIVTVAQWRLICTAVMHVCDGDRFHVFTFNCCLF